jgi:flagellar basal body-associated protein FliL
MNSTGKIVAGIIVLIIVVAGAFYWFMHSKSGTPSFTASSTSMTATTSNTASAQSGTIDAAGAAALPGGTSDSDAALQQDTAAIDAQMGGLNTDNTNTSASLNDQPISQQ